MKVLHIIASVDPASGGPAEYLRHITVAMTAQGHDAEIVCLDPRGAHFPGLYSVPMAALGRWAGPYGFSPELGSWMAGNAGRFDVAVIHGLWNHAAIGPRRALLAAGLPYVVFAHGMLDPWFAGQNRLKHLLKRLVWSFVQGPVLRDAHAVLFTCAEERRLAEGAFPGHAFSSRIVAFGTAAPPPADPAQIAAFRATVPTLGEHPYLLFLGRLHPKKGLDLLVEAFAGIAPSQLELDLVIAGPDPAGLQSKLMARANGLGIGKRIHWSGMLSGAAKWGAFRGADAFVLPSHQENFGIAVAEAMACGVPVLISNKVNIWREVEACGGGLVTGDDAAAFQKFLARWLALPEAEKLSTREAARQGFARHFHIETAATDLIEVLGEACGRSGA
jgi:glycosyltransferase involved in cell wall biosynthesis